jgi:transcriptional regulator with XRE-family HTH domain
MIFAISWVMWKIKFRRMLKSKVGEASRGTTRISNREFAAKLGLSSGALSEILSGNRKLSLKTATRIIGHLELNDDERDAPGLVSNWIYFALLAALELDEPSGTPAALAKDLGIKKTEVEEALELLYGHRLISKNDGVYETLHRTLSSSDEKPSPMVVARHVMNIDLGIAALSKVPLTMRDFTGLTFSGNSKKIGKGKKDIRKFLDKFSENMSVGGLDQVYQLNVQLFPVGGWDKSRESKRT